MKRSWALPRSNPTRDSQARAERISASPVTTRWRGDFLSILLFVLPCLGKPKPPILQTALNSPTNSAEEPKKRGRHVQPPYAHDARRHVTFSGQTRSTVCRVLFGGGKGAGLLHFRRAAIGQSSWTTYRHLPGGNPFVPLSGLTASRRMEPGCRASLSEMMRTSLTMGRRRQLTSSTFRAARFKCS